MVAAWKIGNPWKVCTFTANGITKAQFFLSCTVFMMKIRTFNSRPGRTDILCLETNRLIGSYARFGRVYDSTDLKAGRWRDARKWSEEFKENLVDAIGNTLLGSGDVPGGANHSSTHLFSSGKKIICMLQREKLPFFPDPPKSMEPHRLAKLASKIIPGELGKSLGEVTPPYGWTLNVYKALEDDDVLRYSALVHLEYLRWARSS